MLKVVPNRKDTDLRSVMSETKFYEGYSRWDENKERYETWEESVSRVMDMHRDYYSKKMTPELSQLIDEAESLYKLKYALGAQRALQFGGEQLRKHQMRMYNCTSTYADRPRFFSELFYVLLCGAGAGFSVQKHHTDKLPDISERKKQAKGWVVEDSVEGWADALGALMSSYFVGGGQFPEMEGRKIYFDLNNVRPKGAMISGGFKAPGPEPLRKALDKIEHLIQSRVLSGHNRLRPIDVYDIACMLLMLCLLVVFVVLQLSVSFLLKMKKWSTPRQEIGSLIILSAAVLITLLSSYAMILPESSLSQLWDQLRSLVSLGSTL